MWPNPQETTGLVTFTQEILNGKLHYLCSVLYLWWIKPTLKCWIVSLYYFHDCLKNSPFISNSDSGFWIALFLLSSLEKKTSNQNWRLSNVTFWPKPNIPNRVYIKLFNLDLFRTHFTIVFKVLERLSSHKNQTTEIWRRQGQVIRKILTQTIAEKIYWTKLRNRAELDKSKILSCYYFRDCCWKSMMELFVKVVSESYH